MKLKITTNVSVDGVMQGLGASDEDRRGGFERGGWAIPLVDELDLLIYPVIIGQGTRLFPDSGSDIALDLLTSRTTSGGTTIQTYRLAGCPKYAT